MRNYDIITSIVFLIGSIGGLLFIYFKKEYEPKDRWRKILIVSGCCVLIPLSIYILLRAW